MLLLLLGCAHHGLVVHRDPDARVVITSPGPGDHPYTLQIQADGERIDRIALWAGGEPIGELDPGRTLTWRAPVAGKLRIDAYGLRGGVAVTRAREETNVGVGLSAEVVRRLEAYPQDGSMGYYWPPDDGVWWGTARDVWYAGTLVSPADPEGRSHCVGLTWEVAMEALEAQVGPDEPVNGMTLEDLAEFRTDWFVREIYGPGAVDAVVRFGVGERVDKAHVQPGDFLQMWYGGAGGHSGVFLDWVRKGRKIVGVRYWSTHPGTNGIGVREERFGYGGLSTSKFYAARLWRREDWISRAAPGSPVGTAAGSGVGSE